MSQKWKERLYSAYVTSGQAIHTEVNPATVFLPRQPYIKSVIRKHIPANRDIRILDLGCGHGTFLHFLQQAGYHNIYGVDVSAEQVVLARRLGITVIERNDIAGYLEAAENGSTELVLLMDVLEHMDRQELFDLLDEVYRILRPGGKCIAHVPNAAGLYGMQILYGDLTHELAFTPQSVWQAFSTIGFCQIQCFEDKPVIHGIASAFRWLIWQVGTLPSRLLLAAETGGSSFVLSQNMLVTAVKPDCCLIET